jgi:hypothetical protein
VKSTTRTASSSVAARASGRAVRGVERSPSGSANRNVSRQRDVELDGLELPHPARPLAVEGGQPQEDAALRVRHQLVVPVAIREARQPVAALADRCPRRERRAARGGRAANGAERQGAEQGGRVEEDGVLLGDRVAHAGHVLAGPHARGGAPDPPARAVAHPDVVLAAPVALLPRPSGLIDPEPRPVLAAR